MRMGHSLRAPRRCTFVIRIDRDNRGTVTGVIERVRTGEKEAFRGLEAIGGLIARMAEAEGAAPHSPGGPLAEVNRSSKGRTT